MKVIGDSLEFVIVCGGKLFLVCLSVGTRNLVPSESGLWQ